MGNTTPHTSGEWNIEESIAYTFIGEHGNRICMINTLEGCNPDFKANAKLIAAAPKMLQTLIDIKSALINSGKHAKDSIFLDSIQFVIDSATK